MFRTLQIVKLNLLAMSCGLVLLTSLWTGPALAGVPVTCTNCSTVVQQMLDSITMFNELTTTIRQYEELIIQTEQQVFMAQSELKRLATLPGDMVDKYTNHFTELGQRLTDVNAHRGDMSALVDIYRSAYPDFNVMYGLANGETPNGVYDRNPNAIQEDWQRRSIELDKVAEATFKMSAGQLQSLSKNQGALRDHVQRLLSTQNETEIQQASNAMSSMMISEIQDLKSLSAMQMQHESIVTANKQKQEQFDKSEWEKATSGDFNFDYEGKIQNPF
ncbi:MAG: hypothetical protein LBV80_11555 [Deltaproteobacteria bacterium]|jgi:P-type conjugative transfer protein TrbJ|nr:hypothetical protein [Deltaproteobacteria bacterium]